MKKLFVTLFLIYSAGTYADPIGCIGNRVWQDTNNDGIQQRNEPGIAGVRVLLVDYDGNKLDLAITQSKGYFSVCAPEGRAMMRVDIPNAYRATRTNVGGNRNRDSNADRAGIAPVWIKAYKNATHADVGLIKIPADGTTTPTDVPAESGSLTTTSDDLRYGVWVEPRNAMPATTDPGVTAAFPKFDFAHVRGKSLTAVNGNTNHPEYVANILAAARATDTVLDLQLGSSQDYGWNFKTERGNFSLTRWKNAVTVFAKDSTANTAIRDALDSGTIRYIFLIDEPHHSRWSASWDGKNASSGNVNHVTNADLEDMAAHVKKLWGNDVKTIVRSSPVRLVQERRGGIYQFRHLTHAYISPGPTKWLPGKSAPGKGFEWWLRQKNNHTGGLTNCNAYAATNLNMAVMLQWGFNSKGNPYNGSKNWSKNWWEGSVRYPYIGKTSYVKAAPLEMDFIAKHFMVKRDPLSCKPSSDGRVLVDTIVSFRWDRLPTDSGKLPMSSYPHYTEFHNVFNADVRSGNVVPRIGIPVGTGAQ